MVSFKSLSQYSTVSISLLAVLFSQISPDQLLALPLSEQLFYVTQSDIQTIAVCNAVLNVLLLHLVVATWLFFGRVSPREWQLLEGRLIGFAMFHVLLVRALLKPSRAGAPVWAAVYGSAAILRALAYLAEERFDSIVENPYVPLATTLKIGGMLSAVFVCARGLFVATLQLVPRTTGMATIVGPDFLALFIDVALAIFKYTVHGIDVSIDKEQEWKLRGVLLLRASIAAELLQDTVRAFHNAHVLYLLGWRFTVLGVLAAQNVVQAVIATRAHLLTIVQYRRLDSFLSETFPIHRREGAPAAGGGEEEGDLCTICLRPFGEAQELRCGHLFHPFCLRRCLEQSGNACPICRAEILPSSEVRAVSLALSYPLVTDDVRAPMDDQGGAATHWPESLYRTALIVCAEALHHGVQLGSHMQWLYSTLAQGPAYAGREQGGEASEQPQRAPTRSAPQDRLYDLSGDGALGGTLAEEREEGEEEQKEVLRATRIERISSKLRATAKGLRAIGRDVDDRFEALGEPARAGRYARRARLGEAAEGRGLLQSRLSFNLPRVSLSFAHERRGVGRSLHRMTSSIKDIGFKARELGKGAANLPKDAVNRITGQSRRERVDVSRQGERMFLRGSADAGAPSRRAPRRARAWRAQGGERPPRSLTRGSSGIDVVTALKVPADDGEPGLSGERDIAAAILEAKQGRGYLSDGESVARSVAEGGGGGTVVEPVARRGREWQDSSLRRRSRSAQPITQDPQSLGALAERGQDRVLRAAQRFRDRWRDMSPINGSMTSSSDGMGVNDLPCGHRGQPGGAGRRSSLSLSPASHTIDEADGSEPTPRRSAEAEQGQGAEQASRKRDGMMKAVFEKHFRL